MLSYDRLSKTPSTFRSFAGLDITPEKFDTLRGKSVRRLLDSEDWMPEWASDMKKLSDDGLFTVDAGIDSAENQESIRKQLKEEAYAYSSFSGYEVSFLSRNGYTVTDFMKVCECLIEIARPSFHTVFRGDRTSLRHELRRTSGPSNSAVDKILASLIWRPGLSTYEAPILVVASDCMFNMQRILAITTQRLAANFASPIFSDELGKRFEKTCREAFASKGSAVFPGRLDLPFEYLPKEVSQRLWGHVKTSTDIDIIARKGDFLFIVECKERNPPKRASRRLDNLLAKVAVDLQYKTLWIRDNIQEASRMVGADWNKLLADESKILYVPLLVSNFPVELPTDLKMTILSLSELRRLLEKLSNLEVSRSGQEGFLSFKGVVRNATGGTRILMPENAH